MQDCSHSFCWPHNIHVGYQRGITFHATWASGGTWHPGCSHQCCLLYCIALAAILHRAIKQWSQPVQEQKGNQGRCPKWQVGKCTPDVDISVYEAFFFALLLIFMSSDQVHCWSLTRGTEPLEEKVLWIIVFFRNILCNVTATRRLSWGGVLNEWWHEKIHLQL